jgi:Secretion system C-terminal sorting domain
MTKFLKYAVMLFFVAGLSQSALAQVKLSLSMMADEQTYLVSLVSEETWKAPHNAVGSIQVVLKYAAKKSFLAGKITSLVPGVSWTDNAYVESPSSDPAHNFVCFVLNENGTKQIPFRKGEEIPLFTFTNLTKDCVGKLELLDNQDALVQHIVNQDHLNVTQNITVLGARGNAYAGVLNRQVDCTKKAISVKNPSSLINHLRAFPVPTSDQLQVNWENASANGAQTLIIANVLGEIINIRKDLTPEIKGQQSLSLDVSTYPSGLYTGTLVNTKGESQSFRFIVTQQ